jgi:two-component system CheB/CheR fusion protein
MEAKPHKDQKTAQANSHSQQVFPIVAVGASAGGIEAFTVLLKHLPDTPGMAFVFIIHQDPKHESNLAPVLARSTRMPVDVIREGMNVQTNRLYVAPPDAEVSIENGILHLHQRPPGKTTSIDDFFRSLAEDQGSRAISVVLSGSASDGTFGTKEIKAEGGVTFAQDESARMDSMPRSAIAAGFVDFVLSPQQIAAELVRIAQHDYITERSGARLPEAELANLYKLIRSKHDIDFTNYKPAMIERRIRRRMALRKANSLLDYLRIIRKEPEEIEHLYGDILIKVTGFFRNPEVFDVLKRNIFPELIRERRKEEAIRIWVPGCATGEEVYSIAIAALEQVQEAGFSCPVQIFGTDLSDSAIQRARDGLYPETVTAEVSPERLERFFSRVNHGFRVNKAVRDCCIFARQNVTNDPPFSKLDLVSCRNVMIYFGSALQRRVISIFHYALRPNGYLLLGSAETIGSFGDLFGIVDRKHKIYRKRTVSGRPILRFSMADKEHVPARLTRREEEAPAANPVFRDADRVLLAHYSPAGVLINENMDVLQFRGRTSRYLEPPSGTASFNVLKMAREGLLADLRAAIHHARKTDKPNRREDISVKTNEHTITVNLEVIPFVGDSKERFFLVLFEDQQPQKKSARKAKKERIVKEPRSAARLKRELQATREYLQSIIEEQEAMNEELRSANEEIQSSNEELQSTNEELETAKEELQSTNEELTTLNEELENRNDQLGVVNNDLVNLLTSVEIPILMLDGGLRIRRFNPIAQRKLNLINSDIGRPIADLKTTLRLDNLEELVSEVIEKLEVRELAVQDRNGRNYSLRIRPYKTTDNKIDGAVVVLVDLEEFGNAKRPA